jgi:hypothetical protein
MARPGFSHPCESIKKQLTMNIACYCHKACGSTFSGIHSAENILSLGITTISLLVILSKLRHYIHL